MFRRLFSPARSQPKSLPSRELFEDLFESAKNESFPEIDRLETSSGFRVEHDWLNALALELQVTQKKSRPNWQHGRVLYSSLRSYIHAHSMGLDEPLTILETGTARGFSAICLAKALSDAQQAGFIFTIDTIPHDEERLWRSISDAQGPATRRHMVSKWPNEIKRIAFLAGDSASVLEALGLERVHFAFLDGSHRQEDVMQEFRFVENLQARGDLVVFDDVTPGYFDGIVKVVETVESEENYVVRHIRATNARGYAVCERVS